MQIWNTPEALDSKRSATATATMWQGARQFSEFAVTDLSFGGGSKIAARSRMKAKLTLLSKQAISRGYVVDMDVFRLGLLKKDYQSSVKRRRHL